MRKLFTVLVSTIILYGCATTMSGNQQPVTVASNVNGAKCTLQNEKGSWSLQTPGSAVVTNSRENLSVRCEKNGYQSAVVSVPSKHKDSATWGNVVLGGGIGFASYNDEIKSVGNSTGLSYDEDQTDFAAKLKGGVNYSLDSKSFIQGDYGFNFVDSSIDNYTSDFTAHSFNAKFVINF